MPPFPTSDPSHRPDCAISKQAVKEAQLYDVRLQLKNCSEPGFSCRLLLEDGLQHLQQDLSDALQGRWTLLSYGKDLRAEIDEVFDAYSQQVKDQALTMMTATWVKGDPDAMANNLKSEDWHNLMLNLSANANRIVAGQLAGELCQQVLGLVKPFLKEQASQRLALLRPLQDMLPPFFDSYYQGKVAAVEHELRMLVEEHTSVKPNRLAPWLWARLRSRMKDDDVELLRKHVPDLLTCLQTASAINATAEDLLIKEDGLQHDDDSAKEGIKAKALVYITTCDSAERIVRRIRHVMFAKTCSLGPQELLRDAENGPLALASLNLKDALIFNLNADGQPGTTAHKGAFTASDLEAAHLAMRQSLIDEKMQLKQELLDLKPRADEDCAGSGKGLLQKLAPEPSAAASRGHAASSADRAQKANVRPSRTDAETSQAEMMPSRLTGRPVPNAGPGGPPDLRRESSPRRPQPVVSSDRPALSYPAPATLGQGGEATPQYMAASGEHASSSESPHHGSDGASTASAATTEKEKGRFKRMFSPKSPGS